MRKTYICGTASILLLAVVFCGMLRSGRNTGRYLTETSYGPFMYDGGIYVYSDLETFPEERNSDELGFIQSSFLEAMFPVQEILREAELLPVLIGDTEDTGRAYLKVRTDRDRPAARVSELEVCGAVDQVIGQFDEFVVWECRSRSYSLEELENAGYENYAAFQRFSIDRAQVMALRESFPDAVPRLEDFQKKNTVCLLAAGGPEMKGFLTKYYQGVYHIPGMASEIDTTYQPAFYAGILFYEDGKVYYGNYDNEVTGEIRAAVIEGLAHILEGK